MYNSPKEYCTSGDTTWTALPARLRHFGASSVRFRLVVYTYMERSINYNNMQTVTPSSVAMAFPWCRGLQLHIPSAQPWECAAEGTIGCGVLLWPCRVVIPALSQNPQLPLPAPDLSTAKGTRKWLESRCTYLASFSLSDCAATTIDAVQSDLRSGHY